MNAWEEKEFERQKGEDRMGELYKQLKEKERLEEYDKAIEDIVYREKLYHEFDI